MKKEEFYFDSRDNRSKIHAVRYTPENGEVKCIVQIVHGMAEYAERYEELAEFLTGKGFVVTGEDHLGHGKSIGEEGVYGYFCEQDPATVVVRDVHRLKKLTQQQYPGIPYYFIGHSMGSFILRNYLCRYGSGIDGAVIMGTGMQSGALIAASKLLAAVCKVFQGSQHESRLIDRAAFGQYNRKIANPRTEADWLSKDEKRVDAYIADPKCGFVFTINGFQTLFELIARIRKPENLSKMPRDLPVYIVSGTDDPVGDYGKGVKRAYQSLKDAGLTELQMKLYDTDRHELMNELDRDVIMQDIYQWITQQLSRNS